MHLPTLRPLIAAAFATVLVTASALATAQSAYGNKPNGSVKINGLEWLRCSVGQSWNGSTCEGEALKYTFEQAQQTAATFNVLGYGEMRDWRMPTVRELESLRFCRLGVSDSMRDIKDGGDQLNFHCSLLGDRSKPNIT
jgi:hypothetical protein